MRNLTPKTVFEKLVDMALLMSLDPWKNNTNPPGSLLRKLTPEELEEIKKLTPDMVKNYRIK